MNNNDCWRSVCVAGALMMLLGCGIHEPSGGEAGTLEEVSPSGLPVKSLLGTDAKMVFVNRSGSDVRTLCYFDFTTNPPRSYQFTDRVDVYSPVISPDGKWVAWATVEEGLRKQPGLHKAPGAG